MTKLLQTSTKTKNNNKSSLSRFCKPLQVAVVILVALLVSSNWFQLALIQGDSMSPTYKNFQLVVLDKRNNNYQPGDVVAFHCNGFDTVLIKRIVASPGQAVIIENQTLYVDEEPSSLYSEGLFDFAGILETKQTLSANEYIVIGDNISKSKDSRYEQVGKIQVDSIIGKIVD